MNKKGFTLIELLAVIVILAIIAVITVPKIADMISSSRQGGAEDSFYGTLKAAELGYTKALQSNTDLKGSTCNIEDSKITCTNGVEISVSGKTPESGTLTIDSAGSTIAKGLTLNGYKCYGDLSAENPCIKIDEILTLDKLFDGLAISGDGLYKDIYESNKYVYRGENPNNYLTFNDEKAGWRIVSIENDKTVKIVKDKSLNQKMPYDSRITETTAERLNENNTYCRKWTDGIYYGCNAWNAVSGNYINNTFTGTVTQDASLNIYLNNDYYKSLNSDARDVIQKHNFYKGSMSFKTSFEQSIQLEKKDKWLGNIGLLNVSDWYKASTNSECTRTTNGFYVIESGYNRENYKCSNNNYLYDENGYWFISPNNSNTKTAINLRGGNSGNLDNLNTIISAPVKPVMYLNSNLQLEGTGTSSDPYRIK